MAASWTAVVLLLSRADFTRPPVFVVPGSLHSTLYLTATGQDGCPAATAETLYLNWTSLQPTAGSQECWIDRVGLTFDGATGRFEPPRGVSIAPGSSYSTAEIPAVDPWTYPNRSTYSDLVAALHNIGYVSGSTLFAAPYDWRQAPNELARQKYFAQLATSIEDVHLLTGRKVVLLGHSAGPSYILYFLARQPQAWKDAHVRSFVSLNGNLAGEIDCLENLWHGGDFVNPAAGVRVWDRQRYRRAQWSWGITSFCLPSPAVYGDQVLVQIGARKFSSQDLASLFVAFGAAASVGKIWPTVVNLVDSAVPPGVVTYCLFGTGVDTPVHYLFADGNLTAPPVVTFGSGDGQQDDRTNKACTAWPGSVARGFTGADHDGLLSDARLHAFLVDTVLAPE